MASNGQPPLPCALPRPQRALNPAGNIVPTKLALEAKARQGAETFQPLRPSPTPPIRRDASLRTSATQPKAAHLHTAAAAPRSLAQLSSPSLGFRKTLSPPEQSPSKVGPVITLGTLTQDGVEWDVRAQRGRHGLFMVKTCGLAAGLAEKRVFDLVSHENFIKLLSVVSSDTESMELSFEYARFTLAQVLHVHQKMEEQHIQCIAHAIFGALGHLAHHGMVHHQVQAKTIRFTTPDLRIVLSDFGAVTQSSESHIGNSDLKDLGFVLLECMEGHILPAEKHNMDFIADQRAVNKVFGLTSPEQWSGCKDMVDFLDDLFNEKKTASAKYSRPHTFVSSNTQDYECMRPYIELVTLECFTLWTSGD